MLGAFVSGMFEGAKSTFELMEMRNKMEVQNRKMQEGREAERLAKEGQAQPTITATPGTATPDVAPTTGTSTPAVTPTPVVDGRQVKQSSNPGDPELWDQIKPYIQKYEGTNSYKTGYGLGEKGDVTKYPEMPGYHGFPNWPGGTDPASGRPTHAAGMYQFQPETWKYFAAREGVNDFSPESQDRVARRMYLEEGLKHWVPFNETLRTELAKAGLLGGMATRAARTGQARPPTVGGREPSADLGGGLAAPAPDLEGQRAAAKPAASAAATSPVVEQIVKPVVSALTSELQQRMPDGSAQMYMPTPMGPSPNPISPTRSVTPADQAAAQSALTPAAAPAVAAAPVVSPPSPRSGMTQRQQYDAAIAAGERPAFPPNQRWNSRGEAVSPELYGPQTRRQPAPGQDVAKGFAAANKIIRLPDGTLVDGAGSVVQPPSQSALFSR